MNIITSVLQLTNLLWYYVLAFFSVYVYLHMYMFMYVLLCLMPHLPMCIQKHVCEFGYTYVFDCIREVCNTPNTIMPPTYCLISDILTISLYIPWDCFYKRRIMIYLMLFIICISCILLYILCFIPLTGQELTSIKMIYIYDESKLISEIERSVRIFSEIKLNLWFPNTFKLDTILTPVHEKDMVLLLLT